ncbi:F-box family protein [Trifolium medium]|uniref:F-box family protein n=1 Tax=Trifolium medium TaxID=97028 RepID=A0A392NRY2_9FABA|nr:F-box family protein [Trifolium medium]
MLKEGKVNMGRLQSANDFFSGLSHVRSLTLESQTIEILSKYNIIIQPFYNLKSLELHTGLKKRNVQALAFLFRSSPTLHTLILEIINDYKIERKVSSIPEFIYVHNLSNAPTLLIEGPVSGPVTRDMCHC